MPTSTDLPLSERENLTGDPALFPLTAFEETEWETAPKAPRERKPNPFAEAVTSIQGNGKALRTVAPDETTAAKWKASIRAAARDLGKSARTSVKVAPDGRVQVTFKVVPKRERKEAE